MKKKTANLLFIGFLAIAVVLNVILFLTVNPQRTESNVFWFVWAFAFPLPLVALLISTIISNCKKSTKIDTLPLPTMVILLAFVAYLIVCIIFGYFDINVLTVPLIINIVITLIATIIILYAIFINKQDKYIEDKILTLRLIQADLEGCFIDVKDEELLTSLKKLSGDIYYSDPMSHDSLKDIEKQLSNTVLEISSKVKEQNLDEIPALIERASGLLSQRNSRCKMLK